MIERKFKFGDVVVVEGCENSEFIFIRLEDASTVKLYNINQDEMYYFHLENINISELKGKIFKSIIIFKDKEEILFTTDNDEHYLMFHDRDCCESVKIEDIIGDIKDLIGMPILMAEKESNVGKVNHDDYYSSTWTFYKFGTVKGYVTIRWLGESNGYYSEDVSLVKLVD